MATANPLKRKLIIKLSDDMGTATYSGIDLNATYDQLYDTACGLNALQQTIQEELHSVVEYELV